MPMKNKRSALYENLDLSNHIRNGGIFSEEYQKDTSFSAHPFQFCTFYTHTSSDNTVHIHPYIQVWYVKSGSYRLFFKDREFTLNERSLAIIPPNCPHRISGCEDSFLMCFEFSEGFVMDMQLPESHDLLLRMFYLECGLIATGRLEPHCRFSDEAAAEFETIFNEVSREFSKDDKFSEWFVRSDLILLLAMIGHAYNIQEIDGDVLKQRESLSFAIKYINENFSEKLYLKDVCQKAMMDRTTFSYLFSGLMQMSFSEYLRYLRVLHAQKLLTETDRTQLDIASACGFQTVSFLHKTFKQYAGCLPGEYRRNMRKTNSISPSSSESAEES